MYQSAAMSAKPRHIRRAIDLMMEKRNEILDGTEYLIRKLKRHKDRHPGWEMGMQSKSVKDLMVVNRGLTPYQIWTWYRLQAKQLNLGDPTRKCHVCPDEIDDLYHIFWKCKHAHAIWIEFLKTWLHAGSMEESDLLDWQFAITSGTPPQMPPTLRHEIEEQIGMVIDEHEKAYEEGWRTACIVAHVNIWLMRIDRIYNAITRTMEEQARWSQY